MKQVAKEKALLLIANHCVRSKRGKEQLEKPQALVHFGKSSCECFWAGVDLNRMGGGYREAENRVVFAC